MKKEKKKKSVKSMFMCLMLICWFLPLLLILGINMHYLASDRFETKIEKEIEQLKFNDKISLGYLKNLVEESREATYDGVLTDLYAEYEKGWLTKEMMLSRDINYLRDHYSRNENIEMAMLWYGEDPKKMAGSTYNTGLGATYSSVETYWKEDHKEVAKRAANLETRIGFYVNDDRVYLIRNIYTSSYENMGTLVFLIHTDHCFQNYTSFPAGTSVTVYLDDQPIRLLGESVTKEETGMIRLGGTAGYTWKNGILRIYHKIDYDTHKLTTLVRFEDTEDFSMLYGYRIVILIMFLCLLPLIFIFLTVFHRNVTRPIQKMMEGAEQIQQGRLGYKLSYEPECSEFRYLADSFNSMSDRLKYQFDHIYEEEIALRDARIKALQSHINPHFMNNTLEIINWEARLSGNEKVSKMIEALGTLMNAAMDRKKQREIPLSEEMVSVNAYLYIISERLGQRIQIYKELPDEIMDCLVPRLILQPVIENAVEHGVVKTGKGTVSLTGYKKNGFLYLDIINNGVLTKEDKERIKKLLDVEQDSSNESSVNLGISNVNQRLRILYGEECGLTIGETEEGLIRARLKIMIKE